MLQMIDEGKALEIVTKYFDILKNTGYIRSDMMSRFVIYLFLLDFVDCTHRFFTESDYNAVDKALGKLFAGGGCLLPYSVACVNKVTVGKNEYMGAVRSRITEKNTVDNDGNAVGSRDRYTEDGINRTV